MKSTHAAGAQSAAHAQVAGCRRVTLLTDFGTADGYVAAMKGVIAAIAPQAIIDDASHDIPAGDVTAASWALGAYWRLYPPGAVHVAVVDPGVGSARRALAVEVEQRVIIVPDNGLITEVLRQAPLTRAVEILARNPLSAGVGPSGEDVSPTFHGRDVFAPAAARIVTGVPLHDLGADAPHPAMLPSARLDHHGDTITGTVVHVDRFGNLITNIPGADVRGGHIEVAGDAELPVLRTYADVASGETLALIGSRGVLEVSVRDGNAADLLGVGSGAVVVWRKSTGRQV